MNIEAKEYKGFEIISQDDIPDCSSKGIYLRHKKTGLEVFHLLNEDTENLCGFCFRTPPESSNGIAHILEHSVLCGSEKFPLRDPFINLENQSLKTYLNALTGPINTMYPVSSVIEEDYFNLVSVYADSVFFPNLKKEAFMQEAYHLEKDDEGNYSIQGVVYNEMKGVYSSFDSISYKAVISSILKGTPFDKDSGGDPQEIPDLTYEQYLAFHKKFYRPDNCLVFLYGNIPTEKQLDFLQEFLINRLEQRSKLYPKLTETPLETIQKMTPVIFDKPIREDSYGPNIMVKDKNENPSVYFTWRLPPADNLEKSIEQRLISEILVQNDGSPLTKAIINSGLITDVSPYNGINGGTVFSSFTIGMDGVKKSNVSKLQKLILKTINNLVKKGINQDDIDCAVMDLEISTKEVRRSAGPFSLTLLRRALKGWTVGRSPSQELLIQDAFDSVKAKINANPDYLKSLLKEYFIENNQLCINVVTPSPKFAMTCREKEEKQIARLRSLISDKELEQQTAILRKFQQQDETELLSCLPHINARKIKYNIPQIHTDFQMLEYESGRQVPFMCNIEPTNGINYFSVCFPIDVLDAKDYPYLPLLIYMITEVGWNGLKWDKCATLINKYSGSFSAASITGECPNTDLAKQIRTEYEKYNFIGREWLCIRVKMLSENTKPCLDFFADCIKNPDFNDKRRIKHLFDEFLADFESSVSDSGHLYMNSLSGAYFNRSKTVDELLSGISNLHFVRTLKGKTNLISKKMQELSRKIFSSGAVIDLICDAKSKTSSVEYIKQFASKLELKMPDCANDKTTFESLKKLIDVCNLENELNCFEKDIQVGYGSVNFKCSSYATIEASAEAVYSHWLSSSLLWEKIRTVCGAYGAFAQNDSVDQLFSIITYRDPNPLKSLEQIEECLRLGAEKCFTEEEVIKVITGTFSSELKPRTPQTLGYVGFERLLTCIHQDDVNKRIKLTLEVTPEQIHNAAIRIYENFKKFHRETVLCPKSDIVSSKINKICL